MSVTVDFEPIRQWARDRNLIDGSDVKSQTVKLMEEVGELASGVAKNKVDVVTDSIGDCVVVLTILAEQHGLTIENCIEAAYKEIRDRKGRMVDGVFVKEEDLDSGTYELIKYFSNSDSDNIGYFLESCPEFIEYLEQVVFYELDNKGVFVMSFEPEHFKNLNKFLEFMKRRGYMYRKLDTYTVTYGFHK